jgi:hypothetical protein
MNPWYMSLGELGALAGFRAGVRSEGSVEPVLISGATAWEGGGVGGGGLTWRGGGRGGGESKGWPLGFKD